MTGIRFPIVAWNFSPCLCIPGTHPASYPLGTVLTRPGREAKVQVKNVWCYTSTSLYVFMLSYLVKHRDNFPFSFIKICRIKNMAFILQCKVVLGLVFDDLLPAV
jgi:hypothetical protein